MWSSRVQLLIEAVPGVFDNLVGATDEEFIFRELKIRILQENLWIHITRIFSPIILHIVSELTEQFAYDKDTDDLQLVVLYSNLINQFPSIESLIHLFFSQRPPALSANILDLNFIRAVFRIRTVLGSLLEIPISQLLFLNQESMDESVGFYMASLISIVQSLSEKESKELLNSRCSPEMQNKLFMEEYEFTKFRLEFEDCGPISYSSKFATTVDGIPFLRSLSCTERSTLTANSPFARSFALAMLTNKPVLVCGPAGSGKSTLIQQFAQLAGAEIISLHLGSAVDAKSLLGGYICGDTPGEFKWLDGPLTQAIRSDEKWIVFEQIEEASPEVLSLISPLLSERRLFVPGRSETIKAGFNTRIFATCFHPLDSSLWAKIQVDFLDKEDLEPILLEIYPNVQIILNRIIPSWECCHLTYHELFRCCERIEKFFDISSGSVSDEVYKMIYRTVVDTFTSQLSHMDDRMKLAAEIARIWNLTHTDAEAYLKYDKPNLIEYPFTISNITIPQIGNREIVNDFANTFTSLHHMESVARSVEMNDPVLLIGETGTGKTTLVQFIARCVGADLTVINMHHQSDTLDIIGGFKPVDLDKNLAPLREKFIELFKVTFSLKNNASYLNKIEVAYGQKQWQLFLSGIVKAREMALKKGVNDDLASEWNSLNDICLSYLSRTDFLQRDFTFGFVEGPLAEAYRNGKWILLDEVNLAPAETLLALAPIIDGNLVLPNGEHVPKHPDFRFFACMNPATDVGKYDLPKTLRHKFVSIYSDETSSESDIKLILQTRKIASSVHDVMFKFYDTARQLSKTILVDGAGQRVMFSLRTLTRSIDYINKAVQYFELDRAVYDALNLAFISPLSPESAEKLSRILDSLLKPKSDKPKQTLIDDDYIEVEGFYVKRGPIPVIPRDDFVLTPTVRNHLRRLAQAAFLKNSPVLLQGPTSSGKTSTVEYLANITGHEFVRINNHEHTEMSEYIGCYTTTESGKFEFVDGALVRAIQSGAWVVLDELNLAPSDVLEALNRLLDQNNKLYVAETQTEHNPAPSFNLFATQNPPGAYGGRKQLSRAFRGRFVEIHVDEIPAKELETILVDRCHTGQSFAKGMVKTYCELRRIRQFSQVFSGKHAFLTVRDLIRWATRVHSNQTYESVACEGFALLGERLRNKEERVIVKQKISQSVKSRNINKDTEVKEEYTKPDIDVDDIVWTSGMIRTVNLLEKCVKNHEPVLLVGETGTGKTTAVQVIAKMLNRKLRILNCHQHTETSDFIGAMRPSRNDDGKLFEWVDGSLVDAMKDGDIFLMDEISLAQDSALERLNSVLEPSRTLAIAEKPEYEIVKANPNFIFVATMNPGGDYGKRELSPSLRNRFTEIWVPSIESDNDLIEILEANSKAEVTKSHSRHFLEFIRFFTHLSKNLVHMSLRDILQWIRFVDQRVIMNANFEQSYYQGAFMVFIDCIQYDLREKCIEFISKQFNQEIPEFDHSVKITEQVMYVGEFELHAAEGKTLSSTTFQFSAPTTSSNLQRVARALQMPLPVLIEGPPGVGKTSLVASLGAALGYNVVRINLSEHTEMLDLVGSELPVEGAGAGTFSWRDGSFLTALKNGDWVILDELNLASQSVLEGLNSCLDHRAALFIPELGQEFKCHPAFRIFGCQNPAGQGHGRKSLPRSFLNRFTKVYVEELQAQDFEFIISQSYQEIPENTRFAMIHFIADLNLLKLDFEFNLRDVFRWCEMYSNRISVHKALKLLFIDRLRNKKIKDSVLKIAIKHFGDFDLDNNQFSISSSFFRIGDLVIDRQSGNCSPLDLVIHPSILSSLEAVLTCNQMNWPGLLVGTTATSKSSVVRLAAHLVGRKLVEFSMNSSIDTTELLGGFEQMDNHRCFVQLLSKIHLNDPDALQIIERVKTAEELYDFVSNNLELFDQDIIQEANDLMRRAQDPGRFEWVDGLLLQAMRNGWWIIIDNANICPPAVLDRLNPLCEPGGVLSLHERGIVGDEIETVVPHPNFRLFMTVDPRFGEVSRAMRNRSIEIYMPNFVDRRDDPLLFNECKSISNDYGTDFYDLLHDCEHQDFMQLSTWNMIAYTIFMEQAVVASLGTDAAYFNVINCQLTNEKSAMTRSNSMFPVEKEDNKLVSFFGFKPMTNSSLLSVIYDLQFFMSKGINPAAIKYYASQSRSVDFDDRVFISSKWPEVYNVMNSLRNSDLLQFVEDLPIDPLHWPQPVKTLAFTAHYLLVTLNLEPSDTQDIQSVDLMLELSSLIPNLYNELFEAIKFSVQGDSVTLTHLLILRTIDLMNKTKSNSLSLFRFLQSLITKAKMNIDSINKVTELICPNNSLVATKKRKALGQVFSFKTEKAFILWTEINKYWQKLVQNASRSFYAQSPQIWEMLTTIICDQQASDTINELFEQLKKISVEKEKSIAFIDEIENDDFQVTQEMKIINLSTQYPAELLQTLSIRTYISTIILSMFQEKEMKLPSPYQIPLDIIALINSYKETKSDADMMFALFELLHQIGRDITTGPTFETFQKIIKRKSTLVQSSHNQQLARDLFKLIKQLPAFDLDVTLEALSALSNRESAKLGISPVLVTEFKESFIKYAIEKWKTISSLSEVDDSHYHMVVSELCDLLMNQLGSELETTKEIMYSRTGNEKALLYDSYTEEISELHTIHTKSIKKSRYRGDGNAFIRLRAIIHRMNMHELSEDFAKALDESATSILFDFPLYRDITVPIVTTLRQISFGIHFSLPDQAGYLPFPFTSEQLLSHLFKDTNVHWPLTFALIGRTRLIHPPLDFEIPDQATEFHTQTEEEKIQQQIEELFSKRKKEHLNILAGHFVDSILKPENYQIEKILKMMQKQINKLQINKPSIEIDSMYLPLLMYSLSNKNSINPEPINIYAKSSTEDIEELLRIVRMVLEIIDGLWPRYPGHDQLRRITKSADFILSQEIDSPLIIFTDALENLIENIRDWQNKERDFHPVLSPIVKLANKFLKMRLQSWKQIFETRRKVLEENIGRQFYMLLAQLSDCTTENIPDFFASVCQFIESSSIGLLGSNLRLVEALAIYSQRFIDRDLSDVMPLLLNIVTKFKRFIPVIERHIKSELAPLEKTMKEFIDLQKWDSDSDKKHFIKIENVKRQLNKYCQKHLAILQSPFKLMIDDLTMNISKEETVPYDLKTELDEKVAEILNKETSLRDRVYEARRYSNNELDISSFNNENRKLIESAYILFNHKPLYGKRFERHNDLFGEVLILLSRIRNIWFDPKEDLKMEAPDLLAIAENFVVKLMEQRNKLYQQPFIPRDDIKFVLGQIVAILKSFDKLENNKQTSDSIQKVASFLSLQKIPLEEAIKLLKAIPDNFEDNYAHFCMAMFISRSIEVLEGVKNEECPEYKAKPKLENEHLSLLRFAVASLRLYCQAMTDGYGDKKDDDDDKPQECEGTDGVGLGEGKGDEDITNEIEDEDQLLGDNVNTNEDQQDENDVQKEEGFEVEPEFDGAADVSAEEEEQMDDEMGDADEGDGINSRETEDQTKEAEKDTKLEDEKNEEKTQQGEEDKDEVNNDEEPEDDKKGEMKFEEEEDNFESDAADWNETPEEQKMDVDDDRMLDGNSEGEEEEEIENEVIEEVPEDIEQIPDEFLGMTAPDKSNPNEEEDQCDDQEVQGEGKGEGKGEGDEGEDADADKNEEEDKEEEEDTPEKKLKDLEKELKIVQRKILKGKNLKEGGEGGELDNDADEGVILPADEAEEHDEDQKPPSDEDDDNQQQKDGDGVIFDGEPELIEVQQDGFTHIKFDKLEGDAKDFAKQEVVFVSKSFSEDSRQRWQTVVNNTREAAGELCEDLRLILEATVAAKMRGDFRTGKRLNIRKIIPFIASGFRKDKIWMRRVQPDQRNYQVLVAIDNSSSMKDTAGELALQSASLMTQALSLLGIGEISVAKFGEEAEIIHKFGDQWNDESGASMMESFQFNEEQTQVHVLLRSIISYLESAKKTDAVQLCFIVSDGRFSNKDEVKKLIVQAQLRKILIVFILLDHDPESSILTINSLIDDPSGSGKRIIAPLMDSFPFPFYVYINDPEVLPSRLSDALRQWFEFANDQ